MAGRSLAEQQARRALAVAELDRLDADHAVVDRQRALAADARRAVPVGALHRQADRARLRSAAASAAARTAVEAAAHLLPADCSLGDVRETLDEARQAVASARALQPVEAEVATLTADLVVLDQHRSRLEHRIESLQRKVTELPDSMSAATKHVDAARAAAPASAQARQRVEVLEGRLTALSPGGGA